VTITPDTALVGERLGKRLSECDADILDRVMRIDVQIALRTHLKIDQPMPADLIEHVVEERNPRLDGRFAGTIKIQPDADPGFQSITLNGGGALSHDYTK